MTKPEPLPQFFPDFRQIYYFAVVAEELNISRAAERLFISQPPLTRQIRLLEDTLGVRLFERHSRGLALTEAGQEALDAALPLLEQHKRFRQRLEGLAAPGRPVRIGLSTAFEQGVFAHFLREVKEALGYEPHMERAPSPRLAGMVRRGRLDYALVALPLETAGLSVRALGYHEPLVAVLPAVWPEAGDDTINLSRLNARPFFWFRREANPAFFDFTKAVFTQMGFRPAFRLEPKEHEVLLSAVAAAEAGALLGESFSVLKRTDVAYRPLTGASSLNMGMGLVSLPGRENIPVWLREALARTLGGGPGKG